MCYNFASWEAIVNRVARRRLSPFVARNLFCVVFLVVTCHSATGLPQGKLSQEQALRRRAEELYGLIQAGRWTEAESYVTKDSLEAFRNQKRKPLLAFQVDTINLDAGGQTATVEVRLQVFAPPSSVPLAIPQTAHWRLVDGVWCVMIPQPAVPFASAAQSSASPAPPPEELKFKGHRYGLGTMQQGQVKVAQFPFTNASSHPVRIADVLTGCDCLQVELEKKEFKPGESGELAVAFDSKNYEFHYEQTIVVRTDPGDLKTRLTISAYVEPAAPSKASVPGTHPSSSPQPDAHNR